MRPTVSQIMMRFIGPKVSMGYRPQVAYNIYVTLGHDAGRAVIFVNSDNHPSCPYESMEAFLKNWEKL